DDGEGRRLVGRRGDAGGDAVGGGDDEAAPLHGARQALAQRRIVIDEQQAALIVGQAVERGGSADDGSSRLQADVFVHFIPSLSSPVCRPRLRAWFVSIQLRSVRRHPRCWR